MEWFPSWLGDLAVIALIGALAQTVNQSMGMGYGVITSTLLLSSGMPPAVVSATVHASEVGTSSTGAWAHWRLRNVDPRVALGLAVPGVIGGFTGAIALSSISASTARPIVAVILIALGVLVLLRFASPGRALLHAPWRARALAPLGLGAGFLDASGGGGWGPVTMGTLMARPPAEPRIVVGTVNTAEAFVTIGATAGFLLAQGLTGFRFAEVFALMLGGVAISVPAALLARHMRPATMGIGVSVLLVTLNTRTIASALGASMGVVALAMLAVIALSLALVATVRGVSIRRSSAGAGQDLAALDTAEELATSA